jgi:dynein heavy chain 2, cytosolic
MVLFLKDVNLPRPDRWGTCRLVTFLQQLVTYGGFYDEHTLEWIGLEGIQIVCSMNPATTIGRHALTTRFTSLMRIAAVHYPDPAQYRVVYEVYMAPILGGNSTLDAQWASARAARQLANSTVSVYEQVRAKFTVDHRAHYVFTPRDLTRWVLGLLRYDLAAVKNGPLVAWAHEAMRIFRDRLVGKDARSQFDAILAAALRSDWSAPDTLSQLDQFFFVTFGALPVAGAPSSGGRNAGAAGGGATGAATGAARGGGARGKNPSSAGPGAGGDELSTLVGRPLGALPADQFRAVVAKGLRDFERDVRPLGLHFFNEVLENMAHVDRILSQRGGAILFAGRAGVGRRTAIILMAYMHHMEVVSPRVSANYSYKLFQQELKALLQRTGVQGEDVVLVLEDHHLSVDPAILEAVNSLVSGGEVPGLYAPEELDALLGPLKERFQDEGFRGTLLQYFALQVQRHLHICVVMDSSSESFVASCEANPALYSSCAVLWEEAWSPASMQAVPRLVFGEEKAMTAIADAEKSVLFELLVSVHDTAPARLATPRHFLTLLETFGRVYCSKLADVTRRRDYLRAGLSKLQEASDLVESLKRDANERSVRLTEKQAEADEALKQITQSMERASDQKREMEQLQEKLKVKEVELHERKRDIDEELKDVQPVLQAAQQAVGNISPASLSDIRSLRAPPDTIRLILEAVLQLMGIYDTSWNSMKVFLGQRGVKDEICNFDAHSVTPKVREAVKALLKKNPDHFTPEIASRAFKAAGPLAAWVKANVVYSEVLEKVQPLEEEGDKLQKAMDGYRAKMDKLRSALDAVDQQVAELKNRFSQRTAEAAELKLGLEKAKGTLEAAQELIGKLLAEKDRWERQVNEYGEEITGLPRRTLLAAASLTYLGAEAEDRRTAAVKQWCELVGVKRFELARFLSTESELLRWRSQSLPSDQLSVENALGIMNTVRWPFIIDPSDRAMAWLMAAVGPSGNGGGGATAGGTGGAAESGSKANARVVESVSLQDANFNTALELAVRFGKTLVIRDASCVPPVLFPILRRDVICQGERQLVYIGDKLVDYHPSFRVFMITRNPEPNVLPSAAAVVSEVNFTVTRAGLSGQLLAATILHEQPELEKKKSEMLHTEEKLKIQLSALEDTLLEELATSKGNILENKTLLDSLNETKTKSMTIAAALNESYKLQQVLDKERDAYLPLAQSAAVVYFALEDLSKVDHMYQFSLASFMQLFQRALQSNNVPPGSAGSKSGGSSGGSGSGAAAMDARSAFLAEELRRLVFFHVSRALFKRHRLLFAMHMAHATRLDLFQAGMWEHFLGLLAAGGGGGGSSAAGGGGGSGSGEALSGPRLPSIFETDRAGAYGALQSALPEMFDRLQLQDEAVWSGWAKAMRCEEEFPSSVRKRMTPFEQVLVVQALRPDRLESAMVRFVCFALNMKELSAPAESMVSLHAQETSASTVVLFVVSPGADPSTDISEAAEAAVGKGRLVEVPMGQNQEVLAAQKLRECAERGDWLVLKNMHLAVHWLPQLEKELSTMKAHVDFRLWLTSEPHGKFSSILLRQSLKMAYEAPPGICRNLQRTYTAWQSSFISKGTPQRARMLFVLAWFYALIQERRSYVPQGWSKFYEFGNGDLRAGVEVIEQAVAAAASAAAGTASGRGGGRSAQIDWKFVRGLLKQAIFGGRIDNVFDTRVLEAYLSQLFNDDLLSAGAGGGGGGGSGGGSSGGGGGSGSGGRRSGGLFGGLQLPTSAHHQDYIDLIKSLPEHDAPELFGLPANIDRVQQRVLAMQAIDALRILNRPDAVLDRFDRDKWLSELTPLLALWKKLVGDTGLKDAKAGDVPPDASPVQAFVLLERAAGVRLVQRIHGQLRELSRVLRGAQLLTPQVRTLVSALLRLEVPGEWSKEWDGPSEPLRYVRGLVSRVTALESWVQRAESGRLIGTRVNLNELFRPDTFLNALRQQSARARKCAVDDLRLRCRWLGGGRGAGKVESDEVVIAGLLVEGCEFDGSRLTETKRDSAPFSVAPECAVRWEPTRGGESSEGDLLSLPLYFTPTRELLVTRLDVPCSGGEGGEGAQWILAGVAFVLTGES